MGMLDFGKKAPISAYVIPVHFMKVIKSNIADISAFNILDIFMNKQNRVELKNNYILIEIFIIAS